MSGYYIGRDSKQYGPYSESEFGGYVQSGHIQPTDLAWTEGMANWTAVSKMPLVSKPVPTANPPAVAAPATSEKPRNTEATSSEAAASSKASLSPAWQRKFDILRRAGADNGFRKLNTNGLTSSERAGVYFNVLAYVAGPLYYIAKGMTRKGLVLAVGYWLLASLLSYAGFAFDIHLPVVAYVAVSGALCATFANYDYYRLVEHGETLWPGWDVFGSTPALLGAVAVSFGLLWFTADFSALPRCGDTEATSLVRQIVTEQFQKTGLPNEVVSKLKPRLDAIRTQKVNKQTHARSCAAELHVEVMGATRTMQITYTVEHTEKAGEYYVNVFGL